MVLQRLGSATALVPVLGPLVEAQRASKDGDRIGTGLALAQLALDVGGLAGPARLGARAARGAVAARGAAGLGQVLKHTLKRKATDWATRRAREAQVKVSLTALAAALEMPKCRRLLSNHFNLPLDEPPFSLVASADARLHAILARQVYRPPGERRGLRASLMEVQGVSKPGEFWYTYVAGTERRGFWFCPDHGGHLTPGVPTKHFSHSQNSRLGHCCLL